MDGHLILIVWCTIAQFSLSVPEALWPHMLVTWPWPGWQSHWRSCNIWAHNKSNGYHLFSCLWKHRECWLTIFHKWWSDLIWVTNQFVVQISEFAYLVWVCSPIWPQTECMVTTVKCMQTMDQNKMYANYKQKHIVTKNDFSLNGRFVVS